MMCSAHFAFFFLPALSLGFFASYTTERLRRCYYCIMCGFSLMKPAAALSHSGR